MINSTQTAFDKLKKELASKDSEVAYYKAKLNMVREIAEIVASIYEEVVGLSA